MKRTRAILRFTAFAVIAVRSAGPAVAQTGDAASQYRLIPSRSSLQATGGAADINQQFFAYGTFQFAVGHDGSPPGGPPTGEVPHARFIDVQSWLVPDSSIPFQWNTDFTLRLSGLSGSAWPADPGRFEFRGADGQNRPMLLTARQQGELLHLVGENDPGDSGAYRYRFDALAYRAPFADFNLDGMVDGIDAHVLMSHLGTFAQATFEQGDADGDGDVDGNDFIVWQREIGAATAMSAFGHAAAASAGLSAAAVPEPGTATIALAGFVSSLLSFWCRCALYRADVRS